MAAGETQLYAKVSNKHKGRSTPSLLDPLLGMGFPAHTALKALAATGRKTVEEASNWLRCHRDDPSLDDPIPQEYALFLCPTGSLLERLQEFWRESKRQCTRNRAHEVFPHITLCDFFTCEDHKVECLYEALKRAGDRILGSFPSVVPLVLHSSISYLGFFVNDSPADVIREFAMMFATEASVLADCTVKPCTKQLHLTLAHKFYPHHQRTLEQLARAIHPGHGCQWTAALYSRDMRFVHYQTLRALFQYKPQNADELTLSPGDHIFVDPTQQEEASEGWVIGISQRTGCRGFLPENYTEQASESDTWVKHRTYTFSLAMDLISRKDGEASSRRNGELHPSQTPRDISSIQALQATIARRSVLVVRHGERVDQIFGKSWLQQCSTPDGKYYRPDLNFPYSLPRRSNGIKDFENDPPLSSCGIFQSRMAGEALLESGIRVTSVFTSPALRCVQTARHILEELKLEKRIKIRVEPGIFEWTKWESGKATPTLMTLDELKEANFNVSLDYRPAFPLASLLPAESYDEYVERCAVSVGRIIRACPGDVGVILIVSHGSALDSCTRPLLGLPPRDSGDFAQLVRKIPSLGMCFCEENKEEGKWELVNPPVKTLTHGSNSAFNWRNWLPGS
ncbi:ubiquitin-associated and SH3 domain-containing protein A isoform X1 [Ursus americanus]|uniref:Ubiquitin-associated and SH3 domain-containing protein A n=2 Tax=Ursus TaxID=9639 RepID=A0A384DNS5_URSMA|nr:ubiquitin-associated and SH3 domain-containing protein A isoform X1 [Ursus maritimus]XP_026354683.3 ubiquitin-associated and SH3 domain-containing protein A isoform X1 [Ursus arctos]XP_045630147.1 ubiquitin-associated and SH3 domain-containing protein A isoform X1 [Ursus americanus]